METGKVRVHIFITGRVQGVFYRAWCKDKADELKLTGWVRNLSAQAGLDDGRVEIVAEGDKIKLTELIELAKKGSRYARVKNVKVEWDKWTGEFKDFSIRY